MTDVLDTCYYVGDSEGLVKVERPSALFDAPHPSPAAVLRSYVPSPDSPVFRLRSCHRAQSQKSSSPILLRRTQLKDGQPPSKRPSTWTEDIGNGRGNKKYTRSRSDNASSRESTPLSTRKQKSMAKNFDYVISPLCAEKTFVPSDSLSISEKSNSITSDHVISPSFPYRRSVLDRFRETEPLTGFCRLPSIGATLLELSAAASTPDLINLHSSPHDLSRLRLSSSESTNDLSSSQRRPLGHSRSTGSKWGSVSTYDTSSLLGSQSINMNTWRRKLNSFLPFNFVSLGKELWTENIDQDQYNTFTFTEEQLEKIIVNLEKKLSGISFHNERLQDFILSDHCGMKWQEENGNYENISYNYAMELYCNIYQGKQDLRELKMLQKEENKQYQDLVNRADSMREQQDRKFEVEMQTLVKNYDTDLDTLNKQQKQQVEKAEMSQGLDTKMAARKLKHDQEVELKLFRTDLKQELKLLKQEVDHVPKEKRKEMFRKRKEEKEVEQTEKERRFLERQQDQMDKSMKRLMDQHKAKVALLEKQFLQQKQHLLRNREAALWELEERQLQEKHQLAKRQLKDLFFLKRHQMLTRHEKELEQARRLNARRDEDMTRRHLVEKRRLPRILKNEAKTRQQMYKQSLRISMIGTPEEERDKIKQFEESEKKRYKAEIRRQELKHDKQWSEMKAKNDAIIHELEQLQGEKRKMLMEHETMKIKELEDLYSKDMGEWKAKLRPRKQTLEEEFARQREEQEKFYGGSLWSEDRDTLQYLSNEDGYASQNSSRSSPGSSKHGASPKPSSRGASPKLSSKTSSPTSARASTVI